MAQLVFILGRSGTGKSYSMRNFPKDKLAVINVQGKILPFKGSGQIEMSRGDRSDEIIKVLEIFAKKYKSIVIDDYQYVMANEFMRRSTEKGYDKFTEIGRHAWDIANKVTELPDDVIVYLMCHTDRDDEGNEKIKTIGKLLDEKICLEGMSTIVLKTNVTDGEYSFLTQNNGKDTVKSPAGMFPSYAIDNDLYYVDQKIRNYYELGDHLSDSDIEELDESVKKENIPMDDKKTRRMRRGKTEEEKPAETPAEEKAAEKPAEEEQPKRRTRRSSEVKEENDYPFIGPDEKKEKESETEQEPLQLPRRKNRNAIENSMNIPTVADKDYFYETGGRKWSVKKGETMPSADALKDAKEISEAEYYDEEERPHTEEAPRRRTRRFA